MTFEQQNGDVTKHLYEEMGHGIIQNDVDYVSTMVAELVE